LNGRGKLAKGSLGKGQARDHEWLARPSHRFSLGGFGHGRQRRHIAAADVLGQGIRHSATNLFCGQWFHASKMNQEREKQMKLLLPRN
jgi:hypothetical protein